MFHDFFSTKPTHAFLARIFVPARGLLDVILGKSSFHKREHKDKKKENIILGGDFNIIPSAEDVYNPKSFEDDALFRLEIRKKLREIINPKYVITESDSEREEKEDRKEERRRSSLPQRFAAPADRIPRSPFRRFRSHAPP